MVTHNMVSYIVKLSLFRSGWLNILSAAVRETTKAPFPVKRHKTESRL